MSAPEQCSLRNNILSDDKIPNGCKQCIQMAMANAGLSLELLEEAKADDNCTVSEHLLGANYDGIDNMLAPNERRFIAISIMDDDGTWFNGDNEVIIDEIFSCPQA